MWISKFKEAEVIVLPTTFYRWRQMTKKEIDENEWMIGEHIPIYITENYISNSNPLKAHGDAILDEIEPKYDDLKNDEEENENVFEDNSEVWNWFQNCVALKKERDNVQYFELFIENGYEDMETISLMTNQDLQAIGIVKRGHILKIMNSINKLNRTPSVTMGTVNGDSDDNMKSLNL